MARKSDLVQCTVRQIQNVNEMGMNRKRDAFGYYSLDGSSVIFKSLQKFKRFLTVFFLSVFLLMPSYIFQRWIDFYLCNLLLKTSLL